MRFLLSLPLLAALSMPALADGDRLGPIDLSAVPTVCRSDARIFNTRDSQLAARISVASCEAEVNLGAQQLTDSPVSLAALEVAAQPSLALLDEVIAEGSPAYQIVAQHAKGDLYIGMIVRMRNSIPAIDPSTTTVAAADIMARHADLETKLYDWRDRATSAFDRVAQLASDHPQLAFQNPVVRSVITASNLEGPGVASR